MIEDRPDIPTIGISRRRALILGGSAISLAALSSVARVQSASAATIAVDPWASHIKSFNWDWSQHRANDSFGGQDYDFNYGEGFNAPASGVLSSGSSGSSTFTLNQTVPRVAAAEDGEASGDLAKLVFLHQSGYGSPGSYAVGTGPIGFVGDTGVTSPHLHVHGISTTGGRVDWRKFISGATSPTTPGTLMPVFSRKQSASATTLTTAWQTLTNGASGATDVAAGAGGPGTFDLTANFYISNLPEGSQVLVRAVIQTAATGATSPSYQMSINGAASGVIKAQYDGKIAVPSGSRLWIQAMTPVAGPVIDVWGVDILNFN